jgi:RNA polymerase sigma factor (sigma-70 family)
VTAGGDRTGVPTPAADAGLSGGPGLTPGQEADFQGFYVAHRLGLGRYLRFRLDGPQAVLDVSQNVWLGFLKWWKDERDHGGEPEPMLYLIAKRRVVDYWRRRGRDSRVYSEHDDVSQDTIRELCAPDQVTSAETRLDFDVARAALTERQRLILRMRFDEDLSAAVCAAQLGVTPSGINKAVAAAVQVLRSSQALTGYLAPASSNPQEVRS